MIIVKNLNKKYNDLQVLNNIHLEIEDGEIFGFVGKSGVGKSTLLDCINGLTTYDSGSIEIDGVFVEKLNNKELRQLRKNIGMIFQNFSLVNRKTVFQNIALPMECWGFDKQEIQKRVLKYAELVGLSDKLSSRPDQLSGGQKQRVAIARALTMEPKYILCDECTSALDPKTTKSILTLLENIRNEMGITIIVVTHEMNVVQQLCDRMAVIEKGKISEIGKVTDVFQNKSSALIDLLGEETVSQSSEEGVDITFSMLSESMSKPILWELAKQTKHPYTLVDSKTYNFQSKKYNSFTLNVSDDDLHIVETYLKSKNVLYHVNGKGVSYAQ